MPSIKGTSSVPDSRAQSKAIKSTKFPANFSTRVKLSKVNKPVLTQWIEQRVTTLLGFEDDIVQSTAVNLFLPSPPEDSGNQNTTVDPKTAQIDMAGFLGDEQAAKFASELWELLIDAQQSPMGIPKKILEEKKKELAVAKQKAAETQPQIPLRKPPPMANLPRPPPPPANRNNVAAARPVSPPQHAMENNRNRSREAERDHYRRDNDRRRERDDDRGARYNPHDENRGAHYDSYGRRRDDTERRRERPPPREEAHIHEGDRRMSQSRRSPSDRDWRAHDDYRRDSRRDHDRDYHRRREDMDETRHHRRDDRDRDHRSSREHDRRRSDRSRSRSRERHRRRRDSSSSSSSQSDD